VLKEQAAAMTYALYSSASSGRPMGVLYLGGAQQKLSGPVALTVGRWTHLALTYDGVVMRLFVDGVERASRAVSGSLPASTGVLRLGGNNIWRTEWLDGALDDTRLYNRALSAAEIQTDSTTPLR
jgi:hypothetical protein